MPNKHIMNILSLSFFTIFSTLTSLDVKAQDVNQNLCDFLVSSINLEKGNNLNLITLGNKKAHEYAKVIIDNYPDINIHDFNSYNFKDSVIGKRIAHDLDYCANKSGKYRLKHESADYVYYYDLDKDYGGVLRSNIISGFYGLLAFHEEDQAKIDKKNKQAAVTKEYCSKLSGLNEEEYNYRLPGEGDGSLFGDFICLAKLGDSLKSLTKTSNGYDAILNLGNGDLEIEFDNNQNTFFAKAMRQESNNKNLLYLTPTLEANGEEQQLQDPFSAALIFSQVYMGIFFRAKMINEDIMKKVFPD